MKLNPLVFSIFLASTFSVFAKTLHAPMYVPGGALSPISIDTALTPMPTLHGDEWWYFVGLLHDQKQGDHSLQVTLIRANEPNFSALIGVGGIGFTFKDLLGHEEYLWNFYPDLYSIVNYPVAALNYYPAAQSNFFLAIQGGSTTITPGFAYTFSHDSADTQHQVGQIGALYNLSTRGVGEIGTAQNKTQYVTYQLNMTLKDERSVVPEGMNGYVGPLNPAKPSEMKTWEVTAPNLRVVNWTMTISPLGTVTPASPVQHTMTFNDNRSMQDRIWLDRQMENSAKTTSTIIHTVMMEQKTKTLITPSTNHKPKFMYHGTWMSFCFDKTAFTNICGVAVGFWNKNTPTAVMNTDINAHGGFMNLFTPDSNNTGFPRQIGNTLTEYLSIQGDHKVLPFQIRNVAKDTYQSPITKNTYAKTVTVTIRKNTLISSVLHQIAKDKNDQKNIVLKFTAISPLAENIELTDAYGYYEGAAHVALCHSNGKHCERVGTGFLEQQGYE